jgi:hypothetical protein
MDILDDPEFIKLFELYSKDLKDRIATLEKLVSLYEIHYTLQEEAYYSLKFMWCNEKMNNLVFEHSLALTAKIKDKYPLQVVYSPN